MFYIKAMNFINEKLQEERGESASYMVLAGGLCVAAVAGADALEGVIKSLAAAVEGLGAQGGGGNVPTNVQ